MLAFSIVRKSCGSRTGDRLKKGTSGGFQRRKKDLPPTFKEQPDFVICIRDHKIAAANGRPLGIVTLSSPAVPTFRIQPLSSAPKIFCLPCAFGERFLVRSEDPLKAMRCTRVGLLLCLDLSQEARQLHFLPLNARTGATRMFPSMRNELILCQSSCKSALIIESVRRCIGAGEDIF